MIDAVSEEEESVNEDTLSTDFEIVFEYLSAREQLQRYMLQPRIHLPNIVFGEEGPVIARLLVMGWYLSDITLEIFLHARLPGARTIGRDDINCLTMLYKLRMDQLGEFNGAATPQTMFSGASEYVRD